MISQTRSRAPGVARPAAQPAARTPLSVWAYLALSWLLGWWLIYDGLRQRLVGDYTRLGGRLGPWADLVAALGIDPQRLGLAFVALGFALVGASFGLYWQRRWAYYTGLVAAVVGLAYLGVGTLVAGVCVVLLLLPATRRYALGPDPAP